MDFDIEAKGELTRLLLHAGNIDFEDDRLPISSWPGEHKEKTTFGQLPMLSWDGVELKHIVIEMGQKICISKQQIKVCGSQGSPKGIMQQREVELFCLPKDRE